MFKCKVCSEKDQRIEDLKKENAKLWDFVNPNKLTVQIPSAQRELDQIVSGGNIQPELTEEERLIAEEATRILSGTY